MDLCIVRPRSSGHRDYDLHFVFTVLSTALARSYSEPMILFLICLLILRGEFLNSTATKLYDGASENYSNSRAGLMVLDNNSNEPRVNELGISFDWNNLYFFKYSSW